MLHLVARGTLVTGMLCATLVLASLGWLLYQPGGGGQNAYNTFIEVYRRDPAHAVVYARAYALLVRVTDGDSQHYVIHSLAAFVAKATGHQAAAREQEWRASQHHQ